MAQQQEPNGTDAANQAFPNEQATPTGAINTSSSHPLTKSELDSVGKIIASALINAAKTPPPEQKKDWVAFVNLIITIIIAIGGGLGGFLINAYFNAQNAKIQQELAKFSNTLQYAHLEVNCDDVCAQFQTFQITNAGPATATNVTITIAFDSIEPVWRTKIYDISAFDVSISPLSISKSIHPIMSNNMGVPIKDTYAISVSTITPEQTVKVRINLDSRKTGGLTTYNGTSHVKVFAPLGYTNAAKVFDYVKSLYFRLATMDITATCTNCLGNTLYNSSTKYDRIPMIASTFTSGNSTPLTLNTTQGTTLTPQQSTNTTQSGYVESDETIPFSYQLPKGVKQIALTDPLSLQVTNPGTPNEDFTICQQSTCDQSTSSGSSSGG